MFENEEQRRRVFAVYDSERPHSANPGPIHRGDRDVSDKGAECALLRARKQVVTPQLYVLACRGLGEFIELGQR
jgi:hypothetical protein